MLLFLSGPPALTSNAAGMLPAPMSAPSLHRGPARAARCCTPAAYLTAQHNSEYPSGARSMLPMVRCFLFVRKPRKFFFVQTQPAATKSLGKGRRDSPYRNSRLSRCPSTCPRTVLSPPEANDPCTGQGAHTHTQTQLVCFVCCVSDAPLNGCARLFIICNR